MDETMREEIINLIKEENKATTESLSNMDSTITELKNKSELLATQDLVVNSINTLKDETFAMFKGIHQPDKTTDSSIKSIEELTEGF